MVLSCTYIALSTSNITYVLVYVTILIAKLHLACKSVSINYARELRHGNTNATFQFKTTKSHRNNSNSEYLIENYVLILAYNIRSTFTFM